MKIVISLGGSLLTRELTSENFKKYVDVFLSLKKDGHKIVVVCGGGKVCREYQAVARGLGVGRKGLDIIGIASTHLNAITLAVTMKANYVGLDIGWKNLADAVTRVKKYFGKNIVVAAGYDPGHSTDYNAVMFADAVKADMVVNATNIDGVYDSDPKVNPDAKKFDRLSYDKFVKIISKNEQAPGEYRLFDLKAARLIRKIKLKTLIIDGSNPEEIIRAIEGKHSGTEIS